MARYNYTWLVEYYGTGCMVKRTYIDASTRTEAIEKAHQSAGNIVELICCVRVDKW